MNAEKARKIIAESKRHSIECGVHSPWEPEYYEAQGYIAALKGVEVGLLLNEINLALIFIKHMRRIGGSMVKYHPKLEIETRLENIVDAFNAMAYGGDREKK